MIAALTAVAYNDVADRENIDPTPSLGNKNIENSFRVKDVEAEDDKSESSFETVVHYNSKPDAFWSESTPAVSGQSRRSVAGRKSVKRKSAATPRLYPQLSVYPDISEGGGNLPTTSSEEFGKIAEGILQEMNTRVAGNSTIIRKLMEAKQLTEPVTSPPTQTIFKDINIPLKDSSTMTDVEPKHRFSDVHNKIFNEYNPTVTFLTIRMDSVETHYAAQREQSESPATKPAQSPLRIPKRSQSTLDTQSERSPKRIRNGLDITEKSRFLEGRREESMSEQAQAIQNLTRQEFQKRWAKKLGMVTEGEDSIELESRRMPGKTGLEKGESFTPGKRLPMNKGGKVIPVKNAAGLTTDDSISLSSSREFSIAIQPPSLPLEEPSIMLVRDEPVVPQDKKIPTKHTPKISKMGSRALVIPAAKPATKPIATMRRVSARRAPPPPSPSKIPLSPFKSTNFTMGSVPVNTKSNPRRKSQRTVGKITSPAKPRVTRSVSSTQAAMGKQLTIRPVRSKNVDIQVAVKFDGGRGKRKYAELHEASPSKRIKLNEVMLMVGNSNNRGRHLLQFGRLLHRMLQHHRWRW